MWSSRGGQRCALYGGIIYWFLFGHVLFFLLASANWICLSLQRSVRSFRPDVFVSSGSAFQILELIKCDSLSS